MPVGSLWINWRCSLKSETQWPIFVCLFCSLHWQCSELTHGSGKTSSGAQGPYGLLRFEPRLATSKANNPPYCALTPAPFFLFLSFLFLIISLPVTCKQITSSYVCMIFILFGKTKMVSSLLYHYNYKIKKFLSNTWPLNLYKIYIKNTMNKLNPNIGDLI